MPEEKYRPTYLHPDTFEVTYFDEELEGLMKYEPFLSSIRRMTYDGATLLLEDESKFRIKALDDKINNAWLLKSSDSCLNLTGARFLLEFKVLSPEELQFLLCVYARQQGLHTFIGDEIGDSIYTFCNKDQISLRTYQFFVPLLRKSEYLGGFLASLEAEEAQPLDTYDKRMDFVELALERLRQNEDELRERWDTPLWLSRNVDGDYTEEELNVTFYDLMVSAFVHSLQRAENSNLYEDNGYVELPNGDEGFLPNENWHPNNDDNNGGLDEHAA
jgi:hypothetical protein